MRKYAAKTNQPVREDIQRAREINSREGFSGLFRALERGVALPAVAALVPVVRGPAQDHLFGLPFDCPASDRRCGSKARTVIR